MKKGIIWREIVAMIYADQMMKEGVLKERLSLSATQMSAIAQ